MWPTWSDLDDVASLVAGLDGTEQSVERSAATRPESTVHRNDGRPPSVTVEAQPPQEVVASPEVRSPATVIRNSGGVDDPASGPNSLMTGAIKSPPRHDVPVFVPERRRRRANGLLVAGVVGVGVGVLALLFLWVGGSNPTTPLVVRSVTLGVTPASATGHCPTASFTFSAHIGTNGSGALRFFWIRPDGVTTPAETVNVPANSTAVVETLAFTYTGAVAGSGSATLRVIDPSTLASPPVSIRYLCP